MMFIAVLFILISGLSHAIWNVFTKRSIDKSAFLWLCQLAAIILFLPLLLMELRSIQTVTIAGCFLILASMSLHGVYVLLLAKTYTIGDLSQVYPIMRGTSPLLVPLLGTLMLHESLKLLGWIGIVCIVIGIFLAGDFKGMRQGLVLNKAVWLALTVGIMIAGYTIVDKVTLTYVPPVTLNAASNVGNLLALSWIALRSDALKQEWKVNWRTILLGGLLAPGGYILFLKALELAQVSQLAPMREIGTVFGTLIGIFILREPQARSRIPASIWITAGIILLSQ